MPQHYDPREPEPGPIRDLRRRLLSAAAVCYPEMLRDLAEDVYPIALRSLGAAPAEFSSFLNVPQGSGCADSPIVNRRHFRPLAAGVMRWVEKWDPGRNQWVQLAAMDTVESWVREGQTGDCFVLAADPDNVAQEVDARIQREPSLRDAMVSYRRAILLEQRRITLRVTVDLTESNADAEQRLLDEGASQVRLARAQLRKERGFKRLPTIRGPSLEWTARYHFGRVPYSVIAREDRPYGTDRARAIRTAVRRTASHARLQLREPDRPGRRSLNTLGRLGV